MELSVPYAVFPHLECVIWPRHRIPLFCYTCDLIDDLVAKVLTTKEPSKLVESNEMEEGNFTTVCGFVICDLENVISEDASNVSRVFAAVYAYIIFFACLNVIHPVDFFVLKAACVDPLPPVPEGPR